MVNIKDIQKQIASKKVELNKIHGEIGSLTDQLRKEIVNQHFRKIDPDYLVFGSWPCQKSPTGACMYNRENDRHYDECLVCGEPLERK